MRPSSPVETEREDEGGKDNWLLVGHSDEVQRMGDAGTGTLRSPTAVARAGTVRCGVVCCGGSFQAPASGSRGPF